MSTVTIPHLPDVDADVVAAVLAPVDAPKHALHPSSWPGRRTWPTRRPVVTVIAPAQVAARQGKRAVPTGVPGAYRLTA